MQALANEKVFSEALACYCFKRCGTGSDNPSGKLWHIVHIAVLPCLCLASKLGWIWRRPGTKFHVGTCIQNLSFFPKVKLFPQGTAGAFSPLVSLSGGGVPRRETSPGVWTSHHKAPAQRRSLSKRGRPYLKGSIPSLISPLRG